MNRYDDDEYGDWLYEQVKDKYMDEDHDTLAAIDNVEQLYQQSVKYHTWMNALRSADKMLSLAMSIHDKRTREHFVAKAKAYQERADRAARCWA